ncbi:prolipoprotein diacylglyceryl transferase [Ornithinicoccus hortensis]|uniref:Phosphatidylglycerol--prolipoprotein diacylglyceryl transferase n=1 Tax=Ornithinicoccus hortensis TaxID=82346 RepID=A0A542YRY0_9MICO|nr:prolipoprotein diacylglyceryl transferase [Ornithinicoccus hortensis]TQL50840.1 prolipoprotein diacylglyceryl transferase [Ornithinicoccus hortensis]
MLTSIPSPGINLIEIGPLTIRFYALCLVAGMILAWIIGRRRWVARGGLPETFESMAVVAIPSGIVGARIYHVLTHWDAYFGPGRDLIKVLYIWEGGIAIFGAVLGGGLGAAFVAWRRGARISAFADALAPGLILAQAVGRLGNWFNQELYGGPDDGPLGLEIDPEHRPAEYPDVATFQPTFLYELSWNALGCLLLLWLDRTFKLGWGKLFSLYLVVYGTGRFWIEGIRTDVSYLVGPLRTNQVTALLFVVAGITLFLVLHARHQGREPWVERAGVGGPDEATDEGADAAGPEAEKDAS